MFNNSCRPAVASRNFEVVALLAIGMGSLWPISAQAQREPAPRARVFLPPQYGATALSTVIYAQASYIAASGDFLESAAIARRHHAIAAEHELHNAKLWVQTYFERRELNRAYRLKENPPFLDKQEHREAQTERRITDNTQLVVEGSTTDELNWLLRELAGMSVIHELFADNDPLAEFDAKLKLADGDARHIRLTDGVAGGQQLVFRADAAEMLDVRWPRALRGPAFDEVRERFETARRRVIGQLQAGGRLSRENEEQLMTAIDRLAATFNAAWPQKERAIDSKTYLIYAAGKRSLQAMAASVYRLIETNDWRLFDGSYRFEGDSVVDLIRHLCRYGLEFAPPEPGDEGIYKKLFFAMRTLYLELRPVRSSHGDNHAR
jgi:hypothetical protein